MPTKKWPPPPKSKQTIGASDVGTFEAVFGSSDPSVPFPTKAGKPRLGLMSETVDASVTPEELTLTAEASEEMIRRWIDAARTKEAGDVLSWLNANGCLAFGTLPKALKAIEAGEHRR